MQSYLVQNQRQTSPLFAPRGKKMYLICGSYFFHVNESFQPLKNRKNNCGLWNFQLRCLHQPPASTRSTRHQAYYTLCVSLETWGSVTVGHKQPTFCLKGTGKPRGKKPQIYRWMDVILELGNSCTSTKTSNQQREAPKAPPRPSRQPHGSHMAPEEARSEAGTCSPTWMTTSSRFEAETKRVKNPLELGGQHIYKSK